MEQAEADPIPLKVPIPKQFLEKATGCQVQAHSIEGAYGFKPGDDRMSIMYSISAEVVLPPGGEQETRHYILKCYPNTTFWQGYLSRMNLFYNEVSFYKVWAKELIDFQTKVVGNPKGAVIRPSFPPIVEGSAIDFQTAGEKARTKIYEPLDQFILMVDLKKTGGYRMADVRKGLDLDHVRLVFTELATIHALSWAYKKRVEMDVVKKFPFLHVAIEGEALDTWCKLVDGNVAIAISIFDSYLGKNSHLSQSTTAFQPNVKKTVEFYFDQKEEDEKPFLALHRDPPKDLLEANASDEPWRIICHGDAWCNNYLFQYDEASGKPQHVMLVDFQQTRSTCPTIDLVNLIYTSTTATFRKAHLDQVLQLYCTRFLEVCTTLKVEPLPGFSLQSLKRRFHRSKLHGYMMALLGLPFMLRKQNEPTTQDDSKGEKSGDLASRLVDEFVTDSNSLYAKRLIEIAQELYDDGVI